MNIYIKAFLGFSAFYLLLVLFGQGNIAWFLKPLLLPFLITAVSASENFETRKWLLSALTFSWIGDIILLFADKGELYFIFGLVSFLISHILYIILFIKQKQENDYRKNNIFWVGFVLVLVYLISMLTFLFPTLGDLKIPVAVYALTISTMLIMAVKGYFSWKKTMNSLILIGAVFFITSDSVLAINKFYNPIPSADFLIMFTYIVAQYCITSGILQLNQKK